MSLEKYRKYFNNNKSIEFYSKLKRDGQSFKGLMYLTQNKAMLSLTWRDISIMQQLKNAHEIWTKAPNNMAPSPLYC